MHGFSCNSYLVCASLFFSSQWRGRPLVMSETVPSSRTRSWNSYAGILSRLAVVGVWAAVGVYLSKWGRDCGDCSTHFWRGRPLFMADTEPSTRAAPWDGYQLTLFYLAATGVLSAIATGLHKAARDCYYSIQSRLFQYLGAAYDISSHRIDIAANTNIILALLERLGFRTFQYYWYYDASATAGGYVQHGSLYFPCKSYLLSLVSFLEISHYAYVPRSAREITMVGPTRAIVKLIKESNHCTGGMSVSSVSLSSLKAAFGCGSHITTLDRACLRVDIGLCALLGVVTAGAGGFCVNSWRHSYVGYSCFVFALWSLTVAVKQVWILCTSVRSNIQDDALEAAGLRTPLLALQENIVPSGTVTVYEEEHVAVRGETVASATEQPTNSPIAGFAIAVTTSDWTSDWTYTLLTCRGPRYEGSQQVKYTPFDVDQQDIEGKEGKVQLYTVPAVPYLPDHVAARTRLHHMDEVLYMCVHNPFVDAHLLEALDVLRKISKPQTVVVLLPRLGGLLEEFDLNANGKVFMAPFETRITRTEMDFEHWLMLHSAGAVYKLIFVLPYHDTKELTQGDKLLELLRKDTLELTRLPSNPLGDIVDNG